MAWTILLVDDSRTIQEIVRMSFMKTEFNLVCASDAENGLRMAAEVSPSLILVDLRLPEMDGYAFCEAVKKEAALSAIPVMLLAGKHIEVDRARSKEVGAQGVFIKPFDSQDLIDQAAMLCEAADETAPAEAALPADKPMVAEEAEPVEEPEPIEELEPVEELEPMADEEPLSAEGLITTDSVLQQVQADAPAEDDALTHFPLTGQDEATQAEMAELVGELDGPSVEEPIENIEGGSVDLLQDNLGETQFIPPREAERRAEDKALVDLAMDLNPEDDIAAAEHLDGPVELSDEEAAGLLVEIDEDDDIEIEELDIGDEENEQTRMERLRRMPLSEAVQGEAIQDDHAKSDDLDPFGLGFETEAAGEAPLGDEIVPMDETALEPIEDDFGLEIEPQADDMGEELDLDELEIEPEAVFEDIQVEEAEGEAIEEIALADAVPHIDELAPVEPEDAPAPVELTADEDESEIVSVAEELPQSEILEPAEDEPQPVEPAAEPQEAFVVEHEEEPQIESQPAPTGPSADFILGLFRQSIRQELGHLSAPPAAAMTMTPEFEHSLRDVVRQEVKVAVATLPQAAQGDGTAPQMDQQEMIAAIRQAVRAEVNETINDAVKAAVEAAVTAPATPEAALGKEDIEDIVGRVVGRELAAAMENLPKPEAPPTPADLAEVLVERLSGLFGELREAAAAPVSLEAGTVEEIHTWIQSALSELPSADELSRMLSGGGATSTPAGDGTAPATDLNGIRNLMREELAALTGRTLEAVVWEVVPDLAEQIIKKELDRLTADRV